MESATRPHLNWSDVVQRTASASGVSRAQTERILEAFIALADDTIKRLGTVRIKRIGTLSAEWRSSRVLRSPKDKRRMFLDGRFQVQFRAAEGMKKRLAQLSPQLWKDGEHQAAWRMAETLLSDLELYHAERVPKSLATQTPDEDVRAQCEAAFGPHWRRVIATWNGAVSERVRGERDYLAHCARMRWSR
jgi:nucleoid DNA-binding protein